MPDTVEMQAPRDVLIDREPIELYKVLKFEGLVASGGEAKSVIDDGLVSVNGDVEHRRRRKLLVGDVVVFSGAALCLVRA